MRSSTSGARVPLRSSAGSMSPNSSLSIVRELGLPGDTERRVDDVETVCPFCGRLRLDGGAALSSDMADESVDDEDEDEPAAVDAEETDDEQAIESWPCARWRLESSAAARGNSMALGARAGSGRIVGETATSRNQ